MDLETIMMFSKGAIKLTGSVLTVSLLMIPLLAVPASMICAKCLKDDGAVPSFKDGLKYMYKALNTVSVSDFLKGGEYIDRVHGDTLRDYLAELNP